MGKIRGYVISGIVVVAIIVSFLFITQYLFGVFNPKIILRIIALTILRRAT